MELAVLLKAVPRSEQLRYDARRRTMLRDGAELVVNPFDQRALRVGLELRRTGDRLTAISLGPPGAAGLLREARALGADRAVHLCDPAFAGSDILATAMALAAAVRRTGVGLLLAGARSTDSDTGLVGPEVAALLDVPVVTLARSIRWDGPADAVDVVHDTEQGRATSRVAAPAVVTVGEKAGKPLKVSEEAYARVDPASVETVGPGGIGLSPSEAGAFASPTSVDAVEEVGPSRQVRTFLDGTVEQRVRDAVAALAPLLGTPVPTPPPLAWAPAYDPQREVAVLVSDRAGRVADAAAGTVTHLRRRLPGFTVSAIVYGPEPAAATTRRLSAAGASRGYRFEPGALPFDSEDVARALAGRFGTSGRLAALVCEASRFGREVGGRVAALARVGAVGDAVGARATDGGGLVWTKPSFGGSTLATISCRSAPAVVTMVPGLEAAATTEAAPPGLAWHPAPAPRPACRVTTSGEVDEPLDGPSPDDAAVVVAVGSGVGGPEAIARLRPTLDRWGAALVATRRVVDAGWMPARGQLGLTGRLLAPRLAILLGVRGSANHMIGWRRAGVVVAVNRDPAAEVFASADVGIVGPVEDVVPALDAPLASLLRAAAPH